MLGLKLMVLKPIIFASHVSEIYFQISNEVEVLTLTAPIQPTTTGGMPDN